MATPIILPKQGQTVESCIITRWYKNKGEYIKKGEPLYSYETDKASFDAEAPEDGILLDYFFNEGDEVPVLTIVAIIGKEGEDISEFRSKMGKSSEIIETNTEVEEKIKEEKVENNIEIKKEELNISSTSYNIESDHIKISPRAKALADRWKVPISLLKGSGPGGRIVEKDVEDYLLKNQPFTIKSYLQNVDKLIYVTDTGSGLGGRITDEDIKVVEKTLGDDFEIKKLTNIRKIIAKNMLASMQNSAQLTHHISADARKLLEYRNKFKKLSEEGKISINVTINDLVCYCLIKALIKHPEINGHFLEDSIKIFKHVHLGIAVDTERGLMVPVLRYADSMNIFELSEKIKLLANQCRQGNIDPGILSSTSGSFTITNLGSYGIEMFTPILTVPQIGIVGVNTIMYRPVDLGSGAFGFIPHIGLSLTYDHRAIDGAPASVFLRDLKLEIENININLNL